MTVDLHVFKNDVLEKRAYDLILPSAYDKVLKVDLPPPGDDYVMGVVGDIPFYGITPFDFDVGHRMIPLPGRATLPDIQLKFLESKTQEVLFWYSAWSRSINNGVGVYGYPKEWLKYIVVKWITHLGVHQCELTVWPKGISGYQADNDNGLVYPVISFGVTASTLYLGTSKSPIESDNVGRLSDTFSPKLPGGGLTQLSLPKI
jgi:hypothetical protein